MIEKMPETLKKVYQDNVLFNAIANRHEQQNGNYVKMLEEVVVVFAKSNKGKDNYLLKYAQRFGAIGT